MQISAWNHHFGIHEKRIKNQPTIVYDKMNFTP